MNLQSFYKFHDLAVIPYWRSFPFSPKNLLRSVAGMRKRLKLTDRRKTIRRKTQELTCAFPEISTTNAAANSSNFWRMELSIKVIMHGIKACMKVPKHSEHSWKYETNALYHVRLTFRNLPCHGKSIQRLLHWETSLICSSARRCQVAAKFNRSQYSAALIENLTAAQTLKQITRDDA